MADEFQWPWLRSATPADPPPSDGGRGAVYDMAINNGATPEQAKHEVENHVFGVGFKRDAKGNPIQNGIGSVGHETKNHFAALRRYEGEIAFEKAVREIYRRDPERAKKLGLPAPGSSGI